MQTFDVAAQTTWARQELTPGQKFLWKLKGDRRQKDHARRRIYWRLSNWYKPLVFLTLPNMHWELERTMLSSRRENRRHIEKLAPIPRQLKTSFVSFENDPAIFRLALRKIPGVTSHDGLRVTGARSVSTANVLHFECLAVEDGILAGRAGGVNAAWLDFSGMLTERRNEALECLWAQPEMRFLAITSLKARWTKELGAQISDAGGVGNFLHYLLPKSLLIDEFNYQDVGGAPMSQVILIKEQSR